MIAMVLGAFVTLAVLSLYLSVSRNYSQDERFALLQENGRYALQVLGDDLSMADFWGQVMSTDTITSPITAPVGDCAVGINAYSASDAVLFNNYHASPAQTQFAPCATVLNNLVPNTDVVVIKRVEGAPTASTFIDAADTNGNGNTTETLAVGVGNLQNGVVYVRSHGSTGQFLDSAASTSEAVGEEDWRYVPRLYFVRDYLETVGDGIPTLCRLGLTGKSLSDLQCLAEGVEDFHLQFGIDTDLDGVANHYTATPTAAEMDDIVAVRIYVLMRSNTPDPNYVNAKTYRLGDVNRPAANDGFYRRVYTSTVVVRNIVGRRQFL